MNFTVGEYLNLLEGENQAITSELYRMREEEVSSITYESAKADPGSLFICKGALFKKTYLEEAVFKGSICYISEKDYGLEQVAHILVKNVRAAMPLLAKKFYQVPEGILKYIGITGTKGKTTTTYYIKKIFDEYMKQTGGRDIACLTSVETYDGKERKSARITTPESLELYRHFRNACDSGITYLAMEVSSQALKYGRVSGISFDVGVFLNISEDHISPVEHKNFKDYFCSKLRLFSQVRTAVVNLDSEFSRMLLIKASSAGRILTFGTKPGADIYGHDICVENGTVSFFVTCDRFEGKFSLAMHGIFNVENALASIAVAYAYELPLATMQKVLKEVTLNGRMEEYNSRNQKLKVIVDYAHNGLSFEKIFASVRMEYPDYKIVSVFGCPGGKALNRRRDMGLIAGKFCSKVYLSTDDPGPEEIKDICMEIGRFVEDTGCSYECIFDREEAIKKAIMEAKGDTVVLVLGKGGENNQRIGQIFCAYKSDAEVVRECIREYDSKLLDERMGLSVE
ncbi:MAG: UDP-N-acetylmuramyl-tripeptide synthetase [Lachnospiraceae bacterium]|nr:UDP-N-acetylmuramyl-tripeptide synthetase [Lachnospiraceae bacterium]